MTNVECHKAGMLPVGEEQPIRRFLKVYFLIIQAGNARLFLLKRRKGSRKGLL